MPSFPAEAAARCKDEMLSVRLFLYFNYFQFYERYDDWHSAQPRVGPLRTV